MPNRLSARASAAGRMSAVDDYDLKVLEHWFQTGQIASIVRSEIRGRGIAVSGEDNSWANDMRMIKSANDRFNAARSTSSYRPIERGPAPSPTGGLSSGEAAAQTREKYRYAHCTMNNNANRNVCKQATGAPSAGTCQGNSASRLINELRGPIQPA